MSVLQTDVSQFGASPRPSFWPILSQQETTFCLLTVALGMMKGLGASEACLKDANPFMKALSLQDPITPCHSPQMLPHELVINIQILGIYSLKHYIDRVGFAAGTKSKD